jgi:hypothetical protein
MTIYAGSDSGGSGSTFYSAPLTNFSNWSAMTGIPNGLATNGAATFLAYDAANGILYVSTWQAGVWRYVVPAQNR